MWIALIIELDTGSYNIDLIIICTTTTTNNNIIIYDLSRYTLYTYTYIIYEINKT